MGFVMWTPSLHMIMSCYCPALRHVLEMESFGMKLDVESLRTLRTVVETGGFTEAAAVLGVTQSAVSWKIKRLEERVGLELVKRGQRVEATADGADLLSYAEQIVDAHDAAVTHLTRSDIEGVLRLGSTEDLHSEELVEVLARFGRAYPNIRIDVRVQVSGLLTEWFDSGDVDIAILQLSDEGDFAPRPDDIVLWSEDLVWVQGAEAHIGVTGVVPILSFGLDCTYADQVTESLTRAGIRTNVALECPSLRGVQSAVEAGLGVAALNEQNMTSGMIRWPGGDKVSLPRVSYVIRTATHGDREPVEALRSELLRTLERTEDER